MQKRIVDFRRDNGIKRWHAKQLAVQDGKQQNECTSAHTLLTEEEKRGGQQKAVAWVLETDIRRSSGKTDKSASAGATLSKAKIPSTASEHRLIT